MGILDKIKSLVSGRQDQLKSGIDKASGAVETKVGSKHAPKVDQAAAKAKEVVDKLARDTPSTPQAADKATVTDDATAATGTDEVKPVTPDPPSATDAPPPAAPKDPPLTGV